MNNPRVGDTIISTRGYEFKVVSHDSEQVRAKNVRSKKNVTFKKRDLECIDHDDGLWQEMERQ